MSKDANSKMSDAKTIRDIHLQLNKNYSLTAGEDHKQDAERLFSDEFEQNNRQEPQIKYGQDLVVKNIAGQKLIVSLGIGDGKTTSRYAGSN